MLKEYDCFWDNYLAETNGRECKQLEVTKRHSTMSKTNARILEFMLKIYQSARKH